jgi:hypothetical protein
LEKTQELIIFIEDALGFIKTHWHYRVSVQPSVWKKETHINMSSEQNVSTVE